MALALDLLLVALRLAQPGAMKNLLALVNKLTPSSSDPRRLKYTAAAEIAAITDLLATRIRPSLPCLPRALLRYRALRKLGEPAVLRVGIMLDNGVSSGHAWVTVDGIPFFEDPTHLARYTVLLSYPRDG